MNNLNQEQRRKWWEIATTQDEVDLFTCLARNPNFDWRTIDGVLKELGWTKEHMDLVIKPFIKNRMIISKHSKKHGMSIAYWERVADELEPKNDSEISDEEKLEALNKQIKMTKKKMLAKQQKPAKP